MERDSIEQTLSQLVSMVGNLNKEMQQMKSEITGIKSEMNEMKGEITGIKGEITGIKGEINGIKGDLSQVKQDLKLERIKNENRHKEVLEKFRELKIDQDFIWEKTVRNEREIAKLKGK